MIDDLPNLDESQINHRSLSVSTKKCLAKNLMKILLKITNSSILFNIFDPDFIRIAILQAFCRLVGGVVGGIAGALFKSIKNIKIK